MASPSGSRNLFSGVSTLHSDGTRIGKPDSRRRASRRAVAEPVLAGTDHENPSCVSSQISCSCNNWFFDLPSLNIRTERGYIGGADENPILAAGGRQHCPQRKLRAALAALVPTCKSKETKAVHSQPGSAAVSAVLGCPWAIRVRHERRKGPSDSSNGSSARLERRSRFARYGSGCPQGQWRLGVLTHDGRH
jgi:hypothetical protein